MSTTLEAGLKPPDRDTELAEVHQAEEPRLIWSEHHHRWVSGNELVPENDGSQHVATANASDEDQSQASSSKTLQEGKKPIRAFSEGSNGAIYINFDDSDPENPFEWSKRRKWIITGIGEEDSDKWQSGARAKVYRYTTGAWLTTLVAISGPGLASGIPAMQEELGISHFLGSLAFGLYPLGFGVGPLGWSSHIVAWISRNASSSSIERQFSHHLAKFMGVIRCTSGLWSSLRFSTSL